MSALLSVSDVARKRGCDRTTAWRWLTASAREHGVTLVRDGRTLHVTAADLERLVAADKNSLVRRIAELERRWSAIEEQLALMQKRLDVALAATRR